MTLFEIIVLAIALAMDCFTVSIACGLSQKKIVRTPMISMILLFGIFQGGMTWAGWYGGSLFSHIVQPVDHWIAFALLTYLGSKMIYEVYATHSKEEAECSTCNKGLLRTKNIITMAVATSIDALAVGISFAFTGFNTLSSLAYPLWAIGIASFVISLAGSFIGVFCGKRFNLRMELFGGLVLIGIGTKILIEHLLLNH